VNINTGIIPLSVAREEGNAGVVSRKIESRGLSAAGAEGRSGEGCVRKDAGMVDSQSQET